MAKDTEVEVGMQKLLFAEEDDTLAVVAEVMKMIGIMMSLGVAAPTQSHTESKRRGQQ